VALGVIAGIAGIARRRRRPGRVVAVGGGGVWEGFLSGVTLIVKEIGKGSITCILLIQVVVAVSKKVGELHIHRIILSTVEYIVLVIGARGIAMRLEGFSHLCDIHKEMTALAGL
jgi:hypothetical protein